MKSVLVLDSDSERLRQLGMILRLARAPFHVVWSAEEACNHVATLPEATEEYLCLLVNNVDSPVRSKALLQVLQQQRFPLPVLLVERFPSPLPAVATNDPDSPRLLRCRPDTINEMLAKLASTTAPINLDQPR